MGIGTSSSVPSNVSVSVFTLTVLTVGFVYCTLQIFTIVTSPSDCHYAFFWLDGWFDWTSNFQLSAAAVASLLCLWVIGLFSGNRESVWVLVCQGIFLAILTVVVVVHRAFLFPLATPNWSLVDKVFPVEYIEPLEIPTQKMPEPPPWPHQFPPPPPYPEHPERDSDGPQDNLAEVFKNQDSPLWSELKVLKLCMNDSDEVWAKYHRLEAAFHEWHNNHGWSLGSCPDWNWSTSGCHRPIEAGPRPDN